MARAYRFHELNRTQLNMLARRAIVLLPTGATEQHGPHLTVGTDTLTAGALAAAAADAVAADIDVIVAPTLPFGSSPHHLPFGGTMSVTTETYYRLIGDLLNSLADGGFRRIMIVNGHGGNNELIQLAARDTALNRPLAVAAASYWTMAWPQLVAAGAGRVGHLPGHAGEFETSVIMHLHPALVPAERPARELTVRSDPPMATDSYRSEIHGFWQTIDGYSDSPAAATAEAGARYFAAAVSGVVAALRSFAAATAAFANEE
jgi:creatinine amidohydrolase